ncbi:MAG: IPT/TIG domain-containing protein [Fidelibacterota bacterium]
MIEKVINPLLRIVILLSIFSCENTQYPDDIWDPDAEPLPDPVISSVLPADSTYAGIGIVTITGENFSETLEDNIVFFNGIKGTVLTATTTELEVQTPNIISDSVMIKVAVSGAFLFGVYENYYKLYPAMIEYGPFDDYTDVWALDIDKDENLYVSVGSPDKEIWKVTANQDTTTVYGSTIADKASGMKFGPDGSLYYVNILSFMFIMPPGGGSGYSLVSIPGGVTDLDFDSNGNLYLGGSGNAVYTYMTDGTIKTSANYPEIYIKSIRVFDNNVFVAGEYQGSDSTAVHFGIWKNAIISESGDLDSAELVFDWGDYTEDDGSEILCITFSNDGDIFMGSDREDEALTIYYMDEGYAEPFYETILSAPINYLAWGNGNYLYATNRVEGAKRIIRIDTGREGAPYYGRPN